MEARFVGPDNGKQDNERQHTLLMSPSSTGWASLLRACPGDNQGARALQLEGKAF